MPPARHNHVPEIVVTILLGAIVSAGMVAPVAAEPGGPRSATGPSFEADQ